MKRILPLLFVLFFAAPAFASPLIFKATKELTATEFTEVVTIDTARFRQIRILIANVHEKTVSLERYQVVGVHLVAVEGDDQLVIEKAETSIQYSRLLDTPPSKLQIKIKGFGTFKIFIWASQ